MPVASGSVKMPIRNLPPVFWAQMAVIVLLALAAARLIWSVLIPIGPVGTISAADIAVQDVPEFAGLDPLFGFLAGGGDVVVSTAGLDLFGLRMDRASGRGSAILGNDDVPQQSFDVGEEIVEGITLEEVRFDHVILSNRGVREALYLDQSAPATPVGGAAQEEEGE
jgi:general secretion pathway protein C|tara:strand:- start:9017 stop:9517 length:501 start_codon:yes stop_codon:yes gene_type:complete